MTHKTDQIVRDLNHLTEMLRKPSNILNDSIAVVSSVTENRLLLDLLGGSLSPDGRSALWVLKLCKTLDVDERVYEGLVGIGKCGESDYTQIRRDSYRTVADPSEEKRLIRVLNAFVHQTGLKYLQHMSSIVALFIETLPEPLALEAFTCLVQDKMPTYWTGLKEGCEAGRALAETIFMQVDYDFYEMFQNASYSFDSCVNSWFMRFLAHLKPSEEVKRIWDYLFVRGEHHIVYVVVSIVLSLKNVVEERNRLRTIGLHQRKVLEGFRELFSESEVDSEDGLDMVLHDDTLIRSPLEIFSEQTLLKTRLFATVIIPLAFSLSQSPLIPEDVHNTIRKHATDPAAARYALVKYKSDLLDEKITSVE